MAIGVGRAALLSPPKYGVPTREVGDALFRYVGPRSSLKTEDEVDGRRKLVDDGMAGVDTERRIDA